MIMKVVVKIKKILFCLLSLLAFLFSSSRIVIAEEVELEECLKYYQFGEVKVNLNTKKTSYSLGEKIELLGTVVNKNTFPLLNITVYAHLKRVNNETFLENGHYWVDRLVLAQDLNFLPQETKELSYVFDMKNNYPQGQYQLQYYVFSKEGFYYSGRPFLEEDFAGVTNFEIRDTVAPEVYFDINNLTLNGNSQKVRDYIPIFDSGDNPVISVSLQDLRSQKNDLQGVLKWYRWDDSFEENLVKAVNFPITSNNQTPILQTIFDLEEPGAYLFYLEIDNPIRSIFKLRIARREEKANRLRMNDLGITNYPVNFQEDRAFVCFHSPSEENAPLTRVTLSLLNQQGQILETKSIEDSLTSEVMAISIPLTKLADKLNFSIEADFQNLENPSLSQKVRHDYDCHLFDQSLNDLSIDYQNGEISLQSTNLCGAQVSSAYAERLIIYQDDQIKKEEYNLSAIPSEIDTTDLADGKYKLIVKSGEIEKEMEFEVGGAKEEIIKKRNWFLIVSSVVFLTSLISIVIIKKKRKEREGEQAQTSHSEPDSESI